MTELNGKPHWSVDRKVPLALIFAIFMQTAGAFWWAGTVDNRLMALEDTGEDTKKAIQELTEIKVHMQYQRKALEDIRKILEKKEFTQ